MSKKMSLRNFFKRCFPPCEGYPFILFLNHYTDEYEIVSRSGDVLFVVRRIESLSEEDNLFLARELFNSLHECCFGYHKESVSFRFCGSVEQRYNDICRECNYLLYPHEIDYHPDCFKNF